MAGYENIKDKGFDKRSTGELREIQSRGGKRSGETRRRKAALRETMNRLLTMSVKVEGLSDVLEADGIESTYEDIITMAMIEQAARGDVKAYNAIRATVGQTDKSELDEEEQRARIEQIKANTERMKAGGGEKEGDGVTIINDAPTGEDIGYRDTEVSEDIQQ